MTVFEYNLEEYAQARFGKPFRATELGEIVTRLPVGLRSPYRDGPVIAGGAVRKFALGERIGSSDVDMFFSAGRAFEEAKAAFNRQPGLVITVSPNGRTIDFTEPTTKLTFSLIRGSFYYTVGDALEGMTMTCTQFGINAHSLFVGPYAMQDAARRVLRVNKAEKLERSVKHILRYLNKGFRVGDPRILEAVVAVMQKGGPDEGYQF